MAFRLYSIEKKLAAVPASRWLLAVVLIFVAVHGRVLAGQYQPNSWLFADGTPYFKTTIALAEHGRLEQRALHPQSWYLQDLRWNHTLPEDKSNIALGRHGGWYPKHPILLPLLAVPFYLAFGVPGTLIVNVTLNLIFVLLGFLLARRFVRPAVAVVIAGAIAATPIVEFVSYSFSNDLLGADLILGALECTFADCFGWAGVLTGLALWSRVTNLAFLPALVVIGLSEGGWRKVGRAALFALLPLGIFGVLNTWMFGAPWITSYQRVLVREDGVVKTVSHARRFNMPLAAGVMRLISGPDSVFAAYPLLVPGLAGVAVLAFRQRVVAVALTLFLVLPVMVFAKYDWYRPHFLYPFLGVAGMGVAALFGALAGLRPRPAEVPLPRASRSRLAIASLACGALMLPAGWRHAYQPSSELLTSRLQKAEVWLGQIPCDYWNPQVERWECTIFDNGDWATTGRMLEPQPVKGAPRTAIWLSPGLRSPRRLLFKELPGQRVDLTFALDDESTSGSVDIEVRPRGHAPERLHLEGAGVEQRMSVDLGSGSGSALELTALSPHPDATHLIVEGRVQ